MIAVIDEKEGLFERHELRRAGFGVEAAGFGLCASVLYIDNKPAIAYSWMDEGLAGISVAKPFRRRGLATRLLQELLEQAGDTLHVVDPNEALLRILKRIGRVSAPDGAGVVTVTSARRSP